MLMTMMMVVTMKRWELIFELKCDISLFSFNKKLCLIFIPGNYCCRLYCALSNISIAVNQIFCMLYIPLEIVVV